MNKKQMVKALSYKTGMTLADSNDYLNVVLDIMSSTLKGGEGFASNGGSSLYITANCQNPDLAKKFLAYTFGGSTTTYDAALKDGGVITTCISAGKSDVYNEGVDYFNGQAIYAKIVEMGSHVPVIEQSDYHYTLRTQMAAAVINIHNGTAPADALQAAQDQVNFEMGN